MQRGIFIREESNRFIATVRIGNADVECYVPSSCKLSNLISLEGREVILRNNADKTARTKLSIYAIEFKRNFIILRTTEANDIIFNELNKRYFSFLGNRKNAIKEHTIQNYKADIFLPESKTLLEIKSIITMDDKAEFPKVYSERAIEQLKKVKRILRDGYEFCYIFVSLNPYVNVLSLSKNEKLDNYQRLFKECVSLGMQYRAYSAEIKNGEPRIKRKIDINL